MNYVQFLSWFTTTWRQRYVDEEIPLKRRNLAAGDQRPYVSGIIISGRQNSRDPRQSRRLYRESSLG